MGIKGIKNLVKKFAPEAFETINLNRKILAELAEEQSEIFKDIVEEIKK